MRLHSASHGCGVGYSTAWGRGLEVQTQGCIYLKILEIPSYVCGGRQDPFGRRMKGSERTVLGF